jgi:hypothetical protein
VIVAGVVVAGVVVGIQPVEGVRVIVGHGPMVDAGCSGRIG